MKLPLTFLAICLTATISFAGAPDKKNVAPVEDESWKFTLSMPGWMQGLQGTVGINGIDSRGMGDSLQVSRLLIQI